MNRFYVGRWRVWSTAAVLCPTEATEQERAQSDACSFASANPVPECFRGSRVDHTETTQHEFTGHGYSVSFVSIFKTWKQVKNKF